MKDIAPDVYRQRMLIEGLRDLPFTAEEITTYLMKLGEVLDMLPLASPYTNLSEKYGWSAWMHWKLQECIFIHGINENLFSSVLIFIPVKNSIPKQPQNLPRIISKRQKSFPKKLILCN